MKARDEGDTTPEPEISMPGDPKAEDETSDKVSDPKTLDQPSSLLPATSKEAQSAKSTEQNRLYCMVPFIWTPTALHVYHAIHATWGKRCDILRFFIDPIIGSKKVGFFDMRDNTTNYTLPSDVVVVEDIKRPWNRCREETCRNIWEKLWRSWLYVNSNGDADQAEWFVKIDSDSYLFPENFKRYVMKQGYSSDDHHYFGHVLRHHDVPMVAGAGVFFSRATIKANAKIYRTFDSSSAADKRRKRCRDELTDQEEVITSICLKEHVDVDADHILDDEGREMITVAEIEDAIIWNRIEQGEWWYWQNKPKTHPETGKEMHTCCGDLPITFHGYKDPQWFYKLDHEFYSTKITNHGGNWLNFKWRNPQDTAKYFDRVKKAMKAAPPVDLPTK